MLGLCVLKKREKLGHFMLFFAWLCVFFILLQLPCSAANVENKNEETKKDVFSSIEEKWGIRPLTIRLTAAEIFLDFRFRVIDPDKAALMMKRGDKAYLIDQETGAKFPVPVTKVGPLRQTGSKPRAGKVYPIMFANINRVIKSGSKVTLVIGDFRVENLVVEGVTPPQAKLPQAKQAKWEGVQKMLRNELDSCNEDCGQDRACFDKCDKAHKSRLEKEYQKLLNEK